MMNLQINKVISTKGLTTSFQWKDSEGFYEHDINEFGKLLFEAIKLSLEQSYLDNAKNLQIYEEFM